MVEINDLYSEKMWNSTKKVITVIKRDKYLNEIIKAKNNGFPKVITGIRLCSKAGYENNIKSSRINCS